jgi:hypothetical protein
MKAVHAAILPKNFRRVLNSMEFSFPSPVNPTSFVFSKPRVDVVLANLVANESAMWQTVCVETPAEIVRAMLTVCDCPGFVTGFPPVLIIPTEEQAYWYDIKSLKRFNAFVCTSKAVE